jgi:galactonate dehydratase
MRVADFEIHRIPVSYRGDWIFVRLFDENGAFGWGEGSNAGDDDAMVSELEKQCAALRGKDHDPAVLRGRIAAEAPADKPRRTAFSALEHAVTDLAARREGQWAAALFAASGVRTKSTLPVYANLNRMCKDRKPAAIVAAAKEAMAVGFKRIKFAPFDEVSPDRIARDGTDIAQPGVERLRALRDAVGTQTELMIDCHWRFTPATMPFLAGVARDLGIRWVEDPLPDFEPAAIRRLRDLSGARVTGGEALLLYDDFVKLVASGAVDVLIADVKFVGGAGPLDRICKMAADHGVDFAPHNPSGPVSTAASAHVAAANPNAIVLEYCYGDAPWRGDVARGEIFTGDTLAVGGPGFGIDIDLNAVGPVAR